MSIIYLIDPEYQNFYNNELFNLKSKLNRDNTLDPYVRLKSKVESLGHQIITADLFFNLDTKTISNSSIHYTSIGGSLYKKMMSLNHNNIHYDNYIIFEPPIVNNKSYLDINNLSNIFNSIYTHNTNGFQSEKIKKLYWPQPNANLSNYDFSNRLNRIALINSKHSPLLHKLYNLKYFGKSELYSYRLKSYLQNNFIDLYGGKWGKFFDIHSIWPAYLINFHSIKKRYFGPVGSKLDILKKYNFCLCIENQAINGYITEKIFDAFFSGSIPIYLGAPDINEYIPSNLFINIKDYHDVNHAIDYCLKMPQKDLVEYRKRIRQYLQSNHYKQYETSLENIILGLHNES